MKSLTIKNIPDEVYEVLKRESSRKGTSLNREVIETLSEHAELAARRERMRASRQALEAFVASQEYSPVDSADLIREDRDSH